MAARKASPLSVFKHAEKFPKSATAKLVYVLRFAESSSVRQLQLAQEFPLSSKDYFEGRAASHLFTAGLIAQQLGIASRVSIWPATEGGASCA